MEKFSSIINSSILKNIPNYITLSRFVLTLFFVFAISINSVWSTQLAVAIFAIAAMTDWLDGYLVRKSGTVTKFGKLVDPLADKILVTAGLISLIPKNAIPEWVAITIISREFIITGVRQMTVSQGYILPAYKLGKHKTLWQLVTILFFLFLIAIKSSGVGDSSLFQFLWIKVGFVLIALMLIFTLISAISYLWQYRNLLQFF